MGCGVCSANSLSVVAMIGESIGTDVGVAVDAGTAGMEIIGLSATPTGAGSAVGKGVTPIFSSDSTTGTLASRTRYSPGKALTNRGATNKKAMTAICANTRNSTPYFTRLLI